MHLAYAEHQRKLASAPSYANIEACTQLTGETCMSCVLFRETSDQVVILQHNRQYVFQVGTRTCTSRSSQRVSCDLATRHIRRMPSPRAVWRQSSVWTDTVDSLIMVKPGMRATLQQRHGARLLNL